MPRSRQLIWCGPVFEPTGYADEGRELLLAMERAGIAPALRPALRSAPGFADLLPRAVREAFARQQSRAPQPGYILAQHFPADGFVTNSQSSFNIGRTMFETDSLPPHWVTRCNALDELWVPSQFNIESFRRAGVTTPMYCVPGGIDSEMYRPDVAPRDIPGTRGTVFLAVLEWRQRKGWDALLRAWADAFTSADDVTLVLRASPNALRAAGDDRSVDEIIDAFLRDECGGRAREDVAPIVLLRDTISAGEMPGLYTAAHAYVAPTRGEGWARPFMEAMASGVPVIATRWSAHLEYMNDENSLLLDVRALVDSNDPDAPVYAGQRWAEPSVAHLVTLLRRVHADRAEARAIGLRARQDMVALWPWSRAVDVIKARLKEIVPHAGVVSGVPDTISPPRLRVVVRAGVFGAKRPMPGLEPLLGALATVTQARSDTTLSIACDTDTPVRPSASAPAIAAWPCVLHRESPALAGDVRIARIAADATDVPKSLPGVRSIIAMDDLVANHISSGLALALRDNADDVWVPHLAARAALVTAGVSDERVWVQPFGNIAAECTPHGARFAHGAIDSSALHTSFLLIVLHEQDCLHAETIVRIWQRAITDPAARLSVVFPTPSVETGNAPSWCDRWALRIVSMLGARERRVSFTMLPADLGELGARVRAGDVVIDAASAPSSIALWHTALAAGRPVIAMRSADAEQHLGENTGQLVPAGISGVMNGRDLMQALLSVSDVPTRAAMGAAARARAEAMPTWHDVARAVLARVHEVAARAPMQVSATASAHVAA